MNISLLLIIMIFQRRHRYRHKEEEDNVEYIPLLDSLFFNPISKIICILSFCIISLFAYPSLFVIDISDSDWITFGTIYMTEIIYCLSIAISLFYKRYSRKNKRINKSVLETMTIWIILFGVATYRILFIDDIGLLIPYLVHTSHIVYPLITIILENYGYYWCRFVLTDNDDKSCPICLDDYDVTDEKGEKMATKLLACDHRFHETCIDVWQRNKNNCPLCRT